LGLRSWLGPLAKMAIAAVPAALVLWGWGMLGDWEKGPLFLWNHVVFFSGAAMAVVVYLAVARWIGVAEVERVIQIIRRKTG